MPPKGGRAKRAGSVSASAASLDDSKVVHASLTVDTAAIPEQGAAVSKHKVINNKSGAPAKIAATADLSYVATSSYMTPKGKAVDATPPVSHFSRSARRLARAAAHLDVAAGMDGVLVPYISIHYDLGCWLRSDEGGIRSDSMA